VLNGLLPLVQGMPGDQLTGPQAHALHEAITLYHTDLLGGWYQDWCLYKQGRLQQTLSRHAGQVDGLL